MPTAAAATTVTAMTVAVGNARVDSGSATVKLIGSDFVLCGDCYTRGSRR